MTGQDERVRDQFTQQAGAYAALVNAQQARPRADPLIALIELQLGKMADPERSMDADPQIMAMWLTGRAPHSLLRRNLRQAYAAPPCPRCR